MLRNNNDFSIRQTFGHPFVDFKISHVGETFEKMMGDSESFIPSLKLLYREFMTNFSSQFNSQSVSEDAIYGRVARMWASLTREWHAYYLLLKIGYENNLNGEDIVRNDHLDTFKGIDVYLINRIVESESLKIDILQSTKRAAFFRKKKDSFRLKDQDIPGKKYTVLLGEDYPDRTKQINGWYLLNDKYALKIINHFIKTTK